MKKQILFPGIKFESGTNYFGSTKEYHIYEKDCEEVSGYGYIGNQKIHVAFLLKGIEDVEIDLGGAKLIFHGRIAPFIISKCKNISLKNFLIDYDRPFFTQGEIIKREKKFLDIKIPKEFPYRIDNGCFIAVSEYWESSLKSRFALFQPYDPLTLSPAFKAYAILGMCGTKPEDKNPPMAITQLRAEAIEDGIVRFYGEWPQSYIKGQILTFLHELREKTAILCNESESICVENVRLIHASAMGFVGMFSKDISLKHFDMYLDEQSKGLITINADSVHCFHCSGKILIEDCIFENMLDDAVNIHGNYNLVKKIEGNRLTLDVVAANLEDIKWYRKGDKINIYNGKTQELKETLIVTNAEYPDKRLVNIIVNKDSDAKAGDIVENGAMPEITIKSCITGRNRPRGFLLSSGGKTLVEKCYFNNCACAIHFTGDSTYWYESGPVTDVTIRNCFFDDCGYCGSSYAIMAEPDFIYTEKEPFFHKNIKIFNNVFKQFSGGVLMAKRTDHIVFENNILISSNSYGENNKVEPINLIECGHVKIEH